MSSADMGVLAIDLAAAADVATTDAGRTNIMRARRGLAAVEGWANSARSWYEPVGDNLADTLADLMHLAMRAGLDFDDLVNRARARHIEECEDELVAV